MASLMAKDNSEITSMRFGFGVEWTARRFGLTTRQLNWYIARGYVTPTANPPAGIQGPAHERRFAPTDLADVAVIARLCSAGVRPQRAGEVLKYLRARKVVIPRDGTLLVGNDRKVLLVDNESNVFDVLRNLQGAFAVFLGVEAPATEHRRPRRTRRKWAPSLEVLARTTVRSA